MVALIWWKQRGFDWRFPLPVVALGVLSVLIWGLWFTEIGLIETAGFWNFAPFPFFIPVGLYLLWRAYQTEDAFMAAAATPFLTPYIAPYSLTVVFAFVGCKYKKEVFFVWSGFWIYFIVEFRRDMLEAALAAAP